MKLKIFPGIVVFLSLILVQCKEQADPSAENTTVELPPLAKAEEKKYPFPSWIMLPGLELVRTGSIRDGQFTTAKIAGQQSAYALYMTYQQILGENKYRVKKAEEKEGAFHIYAVETFNSVTLELKEENDSLSVRLLFGPVDWE